MIRRLSVLTFSRFPLDRDISVVLDGLSLRPGLSWTSCPLRLRAERGRI